MNAQGEILAQEGILAPTRLVLIRVPATKSVMQATSSTLLPINVKVENRINYLKK